MVSIFSLAFGILEFIFLIIAFLLAVRGLKSEDKTTRTLSVVTIVLIFLMILPILPILLLLALLFPLLLFLALSQHF